ncbi:gliding motility-associated lipoprotein GldB [Algoriphagus boseongensis]|uniref:Gliding motility-associated lipoprotein GldB n=1 Tax=Algoriphagus boseongensis TaxID=1442587 RepID=A0A4R6T7V3_9BACT|nr:gliding motility lipoprotein GldB [Algoriphagus boseongensis]TDQ16967.1 gliding motility-associated lipoprotein GldB [Algoriphagus boseongensis]
MRRIISFSFLVALVFSFSCGKKEVTCALDEDILDQTLEVELVRLEKEFFEAKSMEEVKFLLEKYPDFAKDYLEQDLYPSVDSLANTIFLANQDSAMQVLYDSVMVEFGDISALQTELENSFKYIKHYFPDFKTPKVYTFVSGFNSDLLINENMIVIGLDYFLPKDHEFQPDIPRYMADRYEREYLVPMIVLAISSRYNQTNPAETNLLSEMIYYGKAYHFVKAIMPCTSDQYIIGYTPEEIDECWANEEYIWSHFVENELLFETNPFEIRKYIGEAPFTDAISTKAPGRLGRWMGWNIVDDYQINQDVSLPDLMMESNAEQIFRQSGYRPRRIE